MSIIRRGLTLAWNKTPPDDPAIGQATERPGLWPDSNLLRLSPFPTLLIGPPSLTSLLLDSMRPSFRLPVVEEVVEIASLPHEGTVILRNVESLDEPRQSELSAWIASSAARLVTVCGGPLYPRVAEGSFSSELYYRLNTVTLVENGQGGMDAQAVRRTPAPRQIASDDDVPPDAVMTLEDIARRAYELFEQRGRVDGRDRDDWLQAEREWRWAHAQAAAIHV